MIDKSKENHAQSLAELQQELKSLKALLLSRGPATVSGAATPVVPSKPSIPAWQLTGSNHFANGPTSSTPVLPGPSATSTIPMPSASKGKEPELPPP